MTTARLISERRIFMFPPLGRAGLAWAVRCRASELVRRLPWTLRRESAKMPPRMARVSASIAPPGRYRVYLRSMFGPASCDSLAKSTRPSYDAQIRQFDADRAGSRDGGDVLVDSGCQEPGAGSQKSDSI